MKKLNPYFLLFIIILIVSCSTVKEAAKEETPLIKQDTVKPVVKEKPVIEEIRPGIPAGSKVLSFKADSLNKTITVYTNKNFSYKYFREDNLAEAREWAKEKIPAKYAGYKINIVTFGQLIENLVPNIYRKDLPVDKKRIVEYNEDREISVVKNLSSKAEYSSGLANRNIALWHSHGWYYNHKLDRWMWQRARLFQIVEDLGTMAFTVPYVIPMLENAGANVYVPRERDLQTNEVIIDNEDKSPSVLFVNNQNNIWKTGTEKAFKNVPGPYKNNFNPFDQGNYSYIKGEKNPTAFANFVPDIPATGEYAVYISYKASSENVKDAHYTVYHSGGKTEFSINQHIGGNTWIYLGKFKFDKGFNPEISKVVVSNKTSEPGKMVSVDAVRFGGGMGVVERNGKLSGKPKFVEGARYWLQFAGFPDSLVYSMNHDTVDYNDDYQSRGEWVNYLIGAPNGPHHHRDAKGLGIPVDLSMAFHTDAGITENDTTIGTLMIFSSIDVDTNRTFPSGVSRLANRDFADIMQTEIVNDIKKKYDPVWNRRQLMDAKYSEATRPTVPSVLLELLSHQNFLDNKFQLDPRYRFDVSRSIYKSMLKYLADQEGRDYVVQPLPVSHFYTEILKNNNIKLSWRPVNDPLEPSAVPEAYILYTRTGDNGFDNGVLIKDTVLIIDKIKPGVVYSYKITAVNKGGESFPSEILSAAVTEQKTDPVLVVNGFDRISAPSSVDYPDYSGFINNIDAGVPDKYDLCFTGIQHTFERKIQWTTDDMPGHGASYADYEGKIVAGNTFDYSYVHGKSILAAGRSFNSVSDEAVSDGFINLNKYKITDFIMGEEKETPWPKAYSDSLTGLQFKVFPEKFKSKISGYLAQGGNIFVTGAYIGTDLFLDKPDNHPDVKFGKDVLKYKLSSERAVKNGILYANNSILFPKNFGISFNTQINDTLYAVEAPNAIDPVNGSETVLRFNENDYSAATAYKNEYGIVAFSFPFETILGEKTRNEVIKYVLEYLAKENIKTASPLKTKNKN